MSSHWRGGKSHTQTRWMKSVAAFAGWSPELTEPIGGVTDETGPERIPWDVMATLSPGSQPVESPGPENIFNQKAIVDWINPYETAVWLLVLYKQVRCCDNASPLAVDPTPQDRLLSRLTLRLDVSSPQPGPPACCPPPAYHLPRGLPASSPPLLVTCSWLDTIFAWTWPPGIHIWGDVTQWRQLVKPSFREPAAYFDLFLVHSDKSWWRLFCVLLMLLSLMYL